MTSLYNIKLYFIRHGYSCANVIRDTLGYTDITRKSFTKFYVCFRRTIIGLQYIKQINETRERNKDLLSKKK